MKRNISVKRFLPGLRALLFLVFLFFLLVLLFPQMRAYSADLETLLNDRTCTVWIEGQVLGDMVIGSRAQLAMVYVDSKLAKAAQENHNAPEWLKWHSQHFGSIKKGYYLFIFRYKTFKPWNFDPELIHVDGVHISKDDIKTRKAFVLQGDVPSEATGTFAALLPLKTFKAGKRVKAGYDTFQTDWEVPR